MDIYIVENNVNNKEFNDKLNQGYIIHKFTINLNKRIDILNKYYTKIIILFNNHFLHYYKDVEYYNNKITYTICNLYYTYIDDEENIISIYDVDSTILNFEIELKKQIIDTTDIGMEKYNDKLSIETNVFNNVNDIIIFVMNESGMNFELSKKYLFDYCGCPIYGLFNYENLKNKKLWYMEYDNIILIRTEYN